MVAADAYPNFSICGIPYYMVDRHLRGPTRGDHKFTLASMVNRLMGRMLAALPTVNVRGVLPLPARWRGAVLPLAGVRAGSSLRW